MSNKQLTLKRTDKNVFSFKPTQYRVTPKIFYISLDGTVKENELFSIYNEKDSVTHKNMGLYFEDSSVKLTNEESLTLHPNELKIFKPYTISYLNNKDAFDEIFELRNRGVNGEFSYSPFLENSGSQKDYSAYFPIHDYIHETKLELQRLKTEYPRKQRIVQNFEWLFDDEYNKHVTKYLGLDRDNKVTIMEVEDEKRIYSSGEDYRVPTYLMVSGIQNPYDTEFNLIIRGIPISMRGIIMSKRKSNKTYNMAFIYPQHIINNPERVKSIEYIEVKSNDGIEVYVGNKELKFEVEEDSYGNNVNPLNIVSFTHENRNTNINPK